MEDVNPAIASVRVKIFSPIYYFFPEKIENKPKKCSFPRGPAGQIGEPGCEGGCGPIGPDGDFLMNNFIII